MNKFEIEQFNKRLDELYKFTESDKKSYDELEIIDWISDCINLFYEIGVDSVIIRNFLDHFQSRTESTEVEKIDMSSFNINSYNPAHFENGLHKIKTIKEKIVIKAVGPFTETITMFGKEPSGNYVLSGSFYYAKIAFSAARNVFKNRILEKQIVPRWLTEEISKNEDLKTIASSLELIESKFEARDSEGLVSETNTLLGSILSKDAELKKKGRLANQLRSLAEDQKKLIEFGVTKDLVKGIDFGRILRNEKIDHKKIPFRQDIPFMIAASFAYLTIFFMECSIVSGKLK